MATTETMFRGLPVLHGDGWVVLRLSYDEQCWFPLAWTQRRTRREAIAVFDEGGGPSYRQMRRAGKVMAVPCTIAVEATHGDD